jgi:3-phosphoshikimate 1-carboxyvinyltransferase
MQLMVTGTSHRLSGELDIPVSKYHAHRALVLASLAPGTSVIHGISRTRQVEWTVSALRALGTEIRVEGDRYVVTGGQYRATDVSERGNRGAEGLLNMGSSGTSLYFLTGLASLSNRPTTLTGMKYFRRRPIKAMLDSLRQMGVKLTADEERPPIVVQPERPLGGDVSIAGTLSQWVSGLLLLAPSARTATTIHITGGVLNEQPYVDLTVRMMRQFGYVVEHSDDWLTFHIPANQTATATNYVIPPDIGSAAFGIAAAALHPSDVLLRGLSTMTSAETDHPEAEFLDIATAMGVPMVRDEATGFVRISHDGLGLQPLDIDCTPIPDLLPIIATMATFTEGTSRLGNVGHIRLKESDRVAAMLQLNRLGGAANQTQTELYVSGVDSLSAARMSSFNDHRVLMSLAVAATRAEGRSTLTYPRAYRISYPTFLEEMTGIGLDLEIAAKVQASTTRPAVGATLGRKALAGPPAAAAPTTAVPVTAVSTSAVPVTALSTSTTPVTAMPTGTSQTQIVPLTERVRQLAQSRPDEPAVIEVTTDEPVVTSWKQLQDEADRVSALLIELGVQRGEAVALQLPNWREFVAITLGIVQIGAVATPIMPVFGPRETTMTLSRSGARVMFLPNVFRKRQPAIELVEVIAEAKATNRPIALEHVVVLQAENRDGQFPPETSSPVPAPAAELLDWTWHYYDASLASVTPDASQLAQLSPSLDDVCQLLFTSGTTGEPKGVQHSHHTLATATAMEQEHLGLGDDDRIFVPSPLAHQTGFLYGMLLAWNLGVPAVLQPVWDAPLALEQAFGRGKATFVQAATPFLTDLVDSVEAGVTAPASLRIFVATGAAVPRALAEKATTVLGTAVLGAFGTTETCLATLASPTDRPENAWGSDGRPLAGIRIRIVDDEGAEVPTGAEGNYELSSPTIFDGYLERPDLTADVFTADGWYRTGDLARLDEAGFLHITGRVKDVINRGGEKVPVVEVENLLYQHPLVAEIAVVAMPDERLGERACAFVVRARTDESLSFEDMQSYLERAGLSKYYWPERLEFIDELPRNTIGKVQKNVLREKAAALVAAAKENK